MLSDQLQQLEAQAIAIWEFLIGAPSRPGQLERLYLKVLAYLVGFFLNEQKAIAATATPGIIGGSLTAYRNRILAISADISDAGITNPIGNNLTIHLLAKSGQPSTALLGLAQSTMQGDRNRMIADTITVQPATALDYRISISIILSQEAVEATTLASANTALETYKLAKQTVLGADIIRTDLIDLLRNIPEIRDVNVAEPATNLLVPPQSYANCTSVSVVSAGRMQ
jgi:phage-related baseplate assembly protein